MHLPGLSKKVKGVTMEEAEGFEPSEVLNLCSLVNCCIKPLCQTSV